MTRNSGQRSIKAKKKYSFVVDGETEFWYFKMMQRNENWPIAIKPELPKKKKLIDQYELVLENALVYDEVFWVIDLDTIVSESKETSKSQKPIDELKNYIAKLKKYKNVHLLINNPCLELWFLLHFEPTSKAFSKCDDAQKALKKYLPDYEKTEKYFTKENNDIYKKLKHKQLDAIENAIKLGNFDGTDSAKAELYKFYTFIKANKL